MMIVWGKKGKRKEGRGRGGTANHRSDFSGSPGRLHGRSGVHGDSRKETPLVTCVLQDAPSPAEHGLCLGSAWPFVAGDVGDDA
jgi:hypothetical protein